LNTALEIFRYRVILLSLTAGFCYGLYRAGEYLYRNGEHLWNTWVH